MSIRLKPLGDRLVIIPIEEEARTASGLVLPDTAKEKPQQGRVLAVGPGSHDKRGKRIPMDIAVEDVVLFSKYSGTDIKLADEKYLILRESDVLAILEG